MLGPKWLVIDEIEYLPFGREEANLFFNVVAKLHIEPHGSQTICVRIHGLISGRVQVFVRTPVPVCGNARAS